MGTERASMAVTFHHTLSVDEPEEHAAISRQTHGHATLISCDPVTYIMHIDDVVKVGYLLPVGHSRYLEMHLINKTTNIPLCKRFMSKDTNICK
jgi:hypothetical protein